MADTPAARARWFHPTPARFVLGLLALDVLLLLSQRFRWFPFNEQKGWTVLISLAAVVAGMLAMGLWFVASLLFHWRFQFSIRTLLALVVVVAIPCSWLATEMKKAKEQREAATAIEKLGRSVNWTKPSGPRWGEKILGDRFFQNVDGVYLHKYARLLGSYFGKPNDVGSIRITDATLEHLRGLSETEELFLECTEVTDVGLERLKTLEELQTLVLTGAKITDAGLKNLEGLIQLQQLGLDETNITDIGLEHLKGLRKLEHVHLDGTKVTERGAERAARLHPWVYWP
jgi:hypothetical protein